MSARDRIASLDAMSDRADGNDGHGIIAGLTALTEAVCDLTDAVRAEREATPPATGVDDEPDFSCHACSFRTRLIAAAEAHERDLDHEVYERKPAAPAVDDEPGVGTEDERRWTDLCDSPDCEDRGWPHRHPTSPPTPEPKGAVEALARVLRPLVIGEGIGPAWDNMPAQTQQEWRESARAVLAALDAGRVPGYGRTAGEGEVATEPSEDEVAALTDLMDKAYRDVSTDYEVARAILAAGYRKADA